MRITEIHLLPEGELTFYEDGSVDLLPYKVDENGEEYTDLFQDGGPV